jgi:hypothetical protein
VEAILKGKRNRVPTRLKKEDKMELCPKASRMEIAIIPVEIGTIRRETIC